MQNERISMSSKQAGKTEEHVLHLARKLGIAPGDEELIEDVRRYVRANPTFWLEDLRRYLRLEPTIV